MVNMGMLGLLARYGILLVVLLASASSAAFLPFAVHNTTTISPKVMIISFWSPEAQVWHDRFPESALGNLTARTIAIPGLSVVYPVIHCTQDGSVCHATTGEGEINAAATLSALALSPAHILDLRHTYFLLGGIAGVNPRAATLGSVAIARFAVQVALQYEIDPRSLPDSWPTGYIGYGTSFPLEYPTIAYGTEVFELNAELREVAYGLASRGDMADEVRTQVYRAKYRDMGEAYAPAAGKPGVVLCDTATSDVYYSGTILSEAFENTTSLWTNGTGQYCMTASEDNAALGALLRAAVWNLVDFSRIIVMRAGSNFDRPPDGVSDWGHLTVSDQNGFPIAIENLFNAGIPIVSAIIKGWNCTFAEGIPARNYIGDAFGSLGGRPDFGLGSLTDGRRVAPGGGVVNRYGRVEGGPRKLELAEMKRREDLNGRKMGVD